MEEKRISYDISMKRFVQEGGKFESVGINNKEGK